MATIVNTPANDSGGNGMGFMGGMLVLLVLVVLFFVYGLPMLRQSASPTISVPEQIDVNVNGGGQ